MNAYGEDTWRQAVARLTERAERAERMLRRAELEYGSRLRKRANRRRELRNLQKAVQRYSTAYRELALRHSAALELAAADKKAMAKHAADAIEYLRARVAELEGAPAVSNLHHLPLTVGDTLQALQATEPDALMVIYRTKEGAWRVGWSRMSMAETCMAKDMLVLCVENALGEAYKSFT